MLTRKRRVIVLVAVLTTLVGVFIAVRPVGGPTASSIFGDTVPRTVSSADHAGVELGVRFSSDVDGRVTGVRFYKGPENTGPHVVSLWTDTGELLASTPATDESAEGWQRVEFSTPVSIRSGTTYRASYFAPNGGYAADSGGFTEPLQSGDLRVPAGGGLFTYGSGGFPRQSFQNTNYYVDVLFVADEDARPLMVATPDARGSDAASTPPASGAPSPTASARRPAARPSTRTVVTTLDLPRIPWEGGADYWRRFPKAHEAGWSDPSFLPIVVWYNGVSSAAEASYDKSLGINTYIGMWEGTPYSLFEDNGLFWVGGALNSSFTADSKNWVGDFLDDEVDGRFTPREGFRHLEQLSKPLQGDGRFKYANYTQMVMSKDLGAADAERYVNGFTDAVSIDMYFYTIPYCDLEPYRDVYLVPVEKANCRTASSYGKTMRSLRARDAVDGKLQSLWQFVELVNGGPAEGPFTANVTGSELKGAVMSSIINEARGIVYFNQSFTGSCTGSALFRQSQASGAFCGEEQVTAAKTVNVQLQRLAPVINTQSYAYDFGPGLDTMLKAADGSVYVFAMIDGSTRPGKRTLTLPPGVSGRTVEVVDEGRSIAVDSEGTFADGFDKESSYHIYKIKK